MMMSLTLFALAAPLLAPQSGEPYVPPGLVEIPAGRTTLGIKESTAKAMAMEHPNDVEQIGQQLGQHKVDVPRFWIGPTEVTNEQYLRYVEDTGSMPPASWVRLTREQRLAIIDELKKEDEGAVLDGATLGQWWEENWQNPDYTWEVTPEEATLPVGFISHEDARAYCRWAGLRLPYESEWVRAARGKSDSPYSFGEFDANKLAFMATKPRELAHKALPASALNNASEFGIFDLSGNMWEWTDSRFAPHPGYKPFSVKTEAGKKNVAGTFAADRFIIKGGSFMASEIACMVDIRPGIPPAARAEILSFRVASSGVPGLNAATYAISDISGTLLGGLPSRVLDLNGIVALEKHRTVDPSEYESRRAAPKKPLPESKLPSSYGVFDRADSLVAIPVAELNVKKGKMERTVEESGPVAIGALHCTTALEAAGVLAGSYILMFAPAQDAETLLELGASLPADQLIEGWKPAKLKKDEIHVSEVWPNLEGISVRADQDMLMLVDNQKNVVGIIPLLSPLKTERIKSAKSEITFNYVTQQIEFLLPVTGVGGKEAWMFHFPLKPRNKDGAMLAPSDWNRGDYKVIEVAEEDGDNSKKPK